MKHFQFFFSLCHIFHMFYNNVRKNGSKAHIDIQNQSYVNNCFHIYKITHYIILKMRLEIFEKKKQQQQQPTITSYNCNYRIIQFNLHATKTNKQWIQKKMKQTKNKHTNDVGKFLLDILTMMMPMAGL